MSAEICVSGSGGNQDGVQPTTIGGSKPLHRFLKGQPKIIGNVMLVLGTSIFIITVALMPEFTSIRLWPVFPPTLLLGIQFIACGILYILTEHNPTKKTVTISLALSIISILGVAWANTRIGPQVGHYHTFGRYEPYYDYSSPDNYTQALNFMDTLTVFESVLLFHTIVGGIILIVMSCLAGAALRSTKTQAVIVMTAAPAETPAVK